MTQPEVMRRGKMKVVDGVRSFFNGQSKEQFGSGERHPLSGSMTKEIKRHIASLARDDLAGYTFERRHSDYPHAKSDIVIYNASGKAVLDGRELSGGEVSFWNK